MSTTISAPVTHEDLGLILQIVNIIEAAYDDYPQNEEYILGSIIVALERLFPIDARRMAKVLAESREEWLHQSPAESFYLTRTQWQAVRILQNRFKSEP